MDAAERKSQFRRVKGAGQMKAYTTCQGQAWDQIAKDAYGAEKYAGFLMQENPELLGIFVFPAGIALRLPDLPEDTASLPPWREEA